MQNEQTQLTQSTESVPPPLMSHSGGHIFDSHAPESQNGSMQTVDQTQGPSSNGQEVEVQEIEQRAPQDRESLTMSDDSKEGILNDKRGILSKKAFTYYSPAQQSRIRKDLHKKLVKLAGSNDDQEVHKMLQSYFHSNSDGKRIFHKLEFPQQTRTHKLETLLPIFRSEMERDASKKRVFISLFRKAGFTKTDVEDTLGVTCSNDLWKRAGQDPSEEEGRVNKKQKIEEAEEEATSITEPISSSTTTISDDNAMELTDAPPLNQLAEEASRAPVEEAPPALVPLEPPQPESETS